jgi:hypothetical protein
MSGFYCRYVLKRAGVAMLGNDDARTNSFLQNFFTSGSHGHRSLAGAKDKDPPEPPQVILTAFPQFTAEDKHIVFDHKTVMHGLIRIYSRKTGLEDTCGGKTKVIHKIACFGEV